MLINTSITNRHINHKCQSISYYSNKNDVRESNIFVGRNNRLITRRIGFENYILKREIEYNE